MPASETDDESEHWLANETPTDWIETPDERVYIRDEWVIESPTSPTEKLVKAGAIVTTALPGDWTIIITGGAIRAQDVQYLADLERKRINLDFYFQRPGFGYLADIIDEVEQDMRDASDRQTEVGTRD
ncbi:hypothetical protein [Halorussus sp. AFM4]|uniref:hypothetical protein n=1 Tax=Halorussus sp. AFM4 TaxID=3421651 RepID=UPI003EBB0BA8